MLYLSIPPEDAGQPAAAFTVDGMFLYAGSHESCEFVARDTFGLYCWVDDGRAVIRRDFSNQKD
jgi:hypothetical protein